MVLDHIGLVLGETILYLIAIPALCGFLELQIQQTNLLEHISVEFQKGLSIIITM